MTRTSAIAGVILGLMLAAAIALALAGCQSNAAYFQTAQRQATAEGLNLDTDTLMNAVCVAKARKPMSQEWRGYCERRGIRGT